MPFPLIAVIIAIASLAINAISMLLRPKVKDRPDESWDVQTATEGRVIPVIWGTDLQESPNVVWWGDQEEEERGGIWRYFVGVAWALAHGPVTLTAILVNDRVVWTGALGNEDALFLDRSEIFGEVGGGIVWDLVYYDGSGATTTPNAYLTGFIADYPHHNRFAYLVSRGPAAWTPSSNWKGFVGNSPQLPQVAFELVRFPAELGPAVNFPGDANPVLMLYETLTNPVWGAGIDPADDYEGIDVASFEAAGERVYLEGLGASTILYESSRISEFVETLLRHIDAAMYREPTTGRWRIKLIRDDYDEDELPRIDETNVINLEEFGVDINGALRDVVRVKFKDRAKQYKDSVVTYRNPAIRAIQGYSSSVELDFPLVRDPGVARAIARREALGYSSPLRRLRARCTRAVGALRPGDAFRFVWSDYAVDTVMRVTSVGLGSPTDGEIFIEAVEDKFRFEAVDVEEPPELDLPLPEWGSFPDGDAGFHFNVHPSFTPASKSNCWDEGTASPVPLPPGVTYEATEAEGYTTSIRTGTPALVGEFRDVPTTVDLRFIWDGFNWPIPARRWFWLRNRFGTPAGIVHTDWVGPYERRVVGD